VVDDQFGSPTWTYRLALQIKELIVRDTKGTFHATSEGYTTPLEYAKHVFKKLKVKVSLEPSSLSEYEGPAKRPRNCILENRLLKKQGSNIMRPWEEDLDTFLNQHGPSLVKQARAKKR
jgi:dTDP-4-dehydrorhamnose reductase